MLIKATAIHPDGSEEELVSFELSDIDSIMEKDVMQKETTTKPKISLSFEYSRSQLFQLLSAKVNVEETVLEEVEPELKIDVKKPSDEDDEKEESEDADSAESSEETEETKAEDEASEETAEVEKEYKEVVVPHSFNVDKIGYRPANARVLSEE